MVQDPNDKCPSDRLDQARSFLIYLANGDRVYHNHKETMAYAGTAFFVTGFISALVSSSMWPIRMTPCFGFNWFLSFFIVVLAWYVFIAYLRFELRGRRLAAVRLSAAEEVLAEWSCKQPSSDDLKAESTKELLVKECWLWPLSRTSLSANEIMHWLPCAFVRALEAKTKDRSPSIKHERLFFLVGHVLPSLLLIKLLIRLLCCIYRPCFS